MKEQEDRSQFNSLIDLQQPGGSMSDGSKVNRRDCVLIIAENTQIQIHWNLFSLNVCKIWQ